MAFAVLRSVMHFRRLHSANGALPRSSNLDDLRWSASALSHWGAVDVLDAHAFYLRVAVSDELRKPSINVLLPPQQALRSWQAAYRG
ncbi:MAG: hypothetical protein ACN6OP_05010 [Pseudomonadales bacterium]